MVMATNTSAVPRSGCSMISPSGTPATPRHDDQPAERRARSLKCGDSDGQRDDQRELGELRRLELERPELEPGLGALALAAER